MFNLTSFFFEEKTLNSYEAVVPCVDGFGVGVELLVVGFNILLFTFLYLHNKRFLTNRFNVYFFLNFVYLSLWLLNVILLYYRVFL